MPEPTRSYLVGERQLRVATVLGTLGMVATLVVILLIATGRPQGRLTPLDPSQFQASLTQATADLEGYALLGNGRARIDINRAMELVAQRGVSDLQLSVSGAPGSASAVSGGGGGASAGGASGSSPSAQATGVDGAAVYQNCSACHQASGQGIPAAFPPLAGHLPDVAAADRSFPIHVVLYGMTGAITVQGQPYNGAMPAWPQLSDAEIAAVLNHEITSWGNADLLPADWTPYAADEVAALRDQGLTPEDVYALRQKLALP